MFVPKKKPVPLVVNVATGIHSSRDSGEHAFPSLSVTGSSKRVVVGSPSNNNSGNTIGTTITTTTE